MYQTRKIVFEHICKHKLEIRRIEESFWRTLRCLEMCWNAFLSGWQISSIKAKTKEKTEN